MATLTLGKSVTIDQVASKKGDAVVQMNYAAIDNAVGAIKEIKYDEKKWATTTEGAKKVTYTEDPYFKAFISPVLDQKGDELPVSAFTGHEDGTVPTGRIERFGISGTGTIAVRQSAKRPTK